MPTNDYRNYLMHHGILGQKWGVRRYQNPDGSLTPRGQKRYLKQATKIEKKLNRLDSKYVTVKAVKNSWIERRENLEREGIRRKNLNVVDKDSSSRMRMIQKKINKLLKEAGDKKMSVIKEDVDRRVVYGSHATNMWMTGYRKGTKYTVK